MDPGKRYRSGGGGAVSTAEDYFRFSQMILNGGELDSIQILSRKTVEYMLSDHIPGFPGSTSATAGPGYGFGLGFAVRLQDGLGVAPGSTGDAMWAGAGGTSFTIDSREKIVGIFMAQAPTSRFHTRFLLKIYCMAHLSGDNFIVRVKSCDISKSQTSDGQALSTRTDLLGPEITAEIAHLRDRLPPFSSEKAKKC